MSPHKSIPMLRIKSCSDPHRWYAGLVGKNVPQLGYDPVSGWKSKEPAGYTNFILTQDAERIVSLVPEYLLGRWPYITHETLAAQHAQVKPAATLPPLTCPWACERFGICQALEGCKDKARIDAELAKATPVGQSRTQIAIKAVAKILADFADTMTGFADSFNRKKP
jgi:hypothetical protein